MRRGRWIVLTLAALAVTAGAVAMVRAATGDAAPRSDKLVLTVKAGEHWLHTFKIGNGPSVTTEPQMAFWLEDKEGKFVATIFVTHKAATEDWGRPRGTEAPPKRPSALPVWYHKHRGIGIEPMTACSACHGKRKAEDKSTAGNPILDAITAATPKAGFTREWMVPASLKPGSYVVRAEINQSLDWNDTYRENAGETDVGWSGGRGGSGQPSLVLEGTIEVGGTGAEITLKPVGHGHPSGATGDVVGETKTLTTALRIVEAVRARYVP